MTGRTAFARAVGIALPVVQAPMVGPRWRLAAAVSGAGGLGSLACAALNPEQVRADVAEIRRRTDGPFNLNFFCHEAPAPDAEREAAWRALLAPYYREFGLDPAAPVAMAKRAPFDAAMAETVAELRPRVVSFHFGLPAEPLLRRVREAGCLILSSATCVREARWLAARGVDAVIAQGAEAGGHRGLFLDAGNAAGVGTIALVPQIVDAVAVPVIAAGGIGDPRGVAAAFALGAAAVQVGTAYLRCPEADLSAPYRAALGTARDEDPVLTNVPTGRFARGLPTRIVRELGPVSGTTSAFPGAAVALQPLRAAAEACGSGDFSPLWAGQAVGLAEERPAAELTRLLAGGVLAPSA